MPLAEGVSASSAWASEQTWSRPGPHVESASHPAKPSLDPPNHSLLENP